jgi:hypothetical protein
MGLSNENPNPHTATIEHYQATVNEMHARTLAAKLVAYEHNEAPKDATGNAPNPNAGIRVRRIDVEKSLTLSRIRVMPDCADHNSRVSGVGDPEQFKHLWGDHDSY